MINDRSDTTAFYHYDLSAIIPGYEISEKPPSAVFLRFLSWVLMEYSLIQARVWFQV
jgi:hypothetical protein